MYVKRILSIILVSFISLVFSLKLCQHVLSVIENETYDSQREIFLLFGGVWLAGVIFASGIVRLFGSFTLPGALGICSLLILIAIVTNSDNGIIPPIGTACLILSNGFVSLKGAISRIHALIFWLIFPSFFFRIIEFGVKTKRDD